MALSTTAVDLNRGSSNVSKILPKEISEEIWAKALEESAVMRLAERKELPGTGITIPMVTGDAAAAWVAESTEKAVSEATLDGKVMTPYKLAVIELFSNEFRRDLPAVYRELARRLPNSIGKKFDETVFSGVAPGSGFDVLTNVTAVNIESTANSGTVYKNLVKALGTVINGDYDVTGWALSPRIEPIILNAVDTAGRPIFIQATTNGFDGALLGRPVAKSKRVYKQGAAGTVDVLGFAGDWSQARWGIVGDISFDISTEATINDGSKQVNLWQRNMFAIRVEAEMAFACMDTDAFVKLTGTATGATAA